MKTLPRFCGLALTSEDREKLRAMKSGGNTLSARTWLRIRVLFLLDGKQSVRATALAVGGYPREISRVGKRYVALGLVAALTDDPRPKRKRLLDSTQEAAIVAMVCGPAPLGRARWTVTLATEEAIRRRVVDKIHRDTIHQVFVRHELKPWREKNVVCAEDRPAVRDSDGGRPPTLRTALE